MTPLRLRHAARFLALPLASFAVVLAVTLVAWSQLKQFLAEADVHRFKEAVSQVLPPLQEPLNASLTPLDQIRRQLAKDEPPAIESREWRQHSPFVFEYGYASRVSQDGKDSYTIQVLDSRTNNSPHHLGSNLAFDAARQQGIQRALELGGPSSGPVVTAFDHQCIVVMYPMYRHGLRLPDAAARDKELLGMGFETLDPALLFATAVKGMPPGLEYRLLGDPFTKLILPLERNVGYGLLGHDWNLNCKPGPAFYAGIEHRLPSLLLWGGIVFALSLAGWQMRQRTMLERRIEARTAELREANQRLEQALAREQEVSEMKSNFISTVSHEFRTPLGVILSSNGILKNYLDRLTPEKRAEHFEAIGKAVARMTEMVEDVLLFSRAEANRLDFNPRPLDLQAFARLIVDEVQSSTDAKCPIEITSTDLPTTWEADEKLLRPILRNLLENAVKYSPPASPVALRLAANGDRMVMEIRDAGIGIPAADLARLGDAFVRARNAENIKGTGLGLAIVQRCAARHGGTLQIISTEGQGTTVCVALPLSPSPAPPTPATDEEDPGH